MGISNKIGEIAKKIETDPVFTASSASNHVNATESILEVQLTDDAMETVMTSVKSRLETNVILKDI